MYWDTGSPVVKVSGLIHLQPDFLDIRTCSLELTLFLDVDMLCAFNDEGNLSLYPSHMYSSLPDLVQQGLPRRIVVIVLKTLDTMSTGSARVSAVNQGHLSGRTQDANYVSFQLESHAPRAPLSGCQAEPQIPLANSSVASLVFSSVKQAL